MPNLVTFDFHNTLAICDEWFYLEIRDLPADVLEHIDPATMRIHDRADVISRYRTLRQGVMASGREIDALDGVARVFDEMGLEIERTTIAESIRHLMQGAMEHVQPVPGAVEAVQEIASRGIPVGVISSAVYHPFLEWSLESFGVSDDLAFVVTSASSGHYKSNPEIYRYAMSLAQAEARNSIHIGDSPKWDVWSAQQTGMRAVLFSNGMTGTMVDRDPESEPDFTVETMSEVAPWVLDQLGVVAK